MNKWIGKENEGKHWTVVAKRGGVVLGFGHYVLDERTEGAAEEQAELPSFPDGTDIEAARYLFEVIGNSEKSIKGKYISESRRVLEFGGELTRDSHCLSASSTCHRPCTSKDRSWSCSSTVGYRADSGIRA